MTILQRILPLSVVTVLCFTSMICHPLAAQSVPSSIAHLYESNVDATVSDDFDAPTVDTVKWGYRTFPAAANWEANNVEIVNDGTDSYVSLVGKWLRTVDSSGNISGTGTSAGLSGRNAGGFGFYTTRWRTEGISLTQRSSWHPAIWSNRNNLGTPSAGGLPVEQIELDFVEYFQNQRLQHVRWHSQAIPRTKVNGEVVQTKIKHNSWDTDFLPQPGTFWNTHGLEYNSNYVQLWEFNELTQQWAKRGVEITISEAPNSSANFNINSVHAKPGYWILSNYDFFERTQELWGRDITGSDNFLMEDSAFQIDHFRLFPQLPPMVNLGDCNLDGGVNFLDISPFITVLSANGFQAEADCDQNGEVNFFDIAPFITILSGG